MVAVDRTGSDDSVTGAVLWGVVEGLVNFEGK